MDNIWQIVSSLLGLLIFLALIFVPILMRQRRDQELTERFSRIQRKRKSRIIALVHRHESMGLLGVAQLRSIDLIDAEEVLDAIRRTPPNKPIELILHTPGGMVLAAVQIARALKAHPARTTVFVPHYAMSGGTLVGLAADEIVLGPNAVLGPIDPQIAGLPAVSLLKIMELKSPDAIGDDTLLFADVGAKALDQLRDIALELLSGTVSPNAAANIAAELTSGRWTHDWPITIAQAKELGLNVSDDLPDDIRRLMDLFPETLRRRSGVRTADLLVPRPKRTLAAPPLEPARSLVTFDGIGPRGASPFARPRRPESP